MSAVSSADVPDDVAAREAAAATANPGRWRAVAVTSLANVVDNTEGGLINTLFPVIRTALNLDLGALGVLTSISKFARMIAGPFWSVLADKYGRKRVLAFVTGVWSIWTILTGLAQNYAQLLILYSIAVVGTVAAEPIINGMMVDLFEDEERGKAYGAVRSLAGLGGLLLTPLIGQLSKVEQGWRIGLFIMGGIGVVTGVLVLLFVREPVRRATTGASAEGTFNLAEVRAIMKSPTVLLLIGSLVFITSLVLFAFFVTYYVEVRGWSTADAALLYTVFLGGFMLSSLIGGTLGDWFDRRFGPRGRIMLMQLYLVVFAVMSFVALQIDWGHGLLLYVVLFFFGLVAAIGFSGAVLPMVAAVVPAELSATAFALLFSLVQGLLTALLSLALGYIAEAIGLQSVMFWLVTAPYAINAVYWFLFYRVYPREVAARHAALAA